MEIRHQFWHILFITGFDPNGLGLGVFSHLFSDNGFSGFESGITDYTGRKTGQFIPVWEASLRFYSLEQRKKDFFRVPILRITKEVYR
jgi:hypothetical protein